MVVTEDEKSYYVNVIRKRQLTPVLSLAKTEVYIFYKLNRENMRLE